MESVRQSVDQEVFMGALSRQECSIEKLRLIDIELLRETVAIQVPDDSNGIPKNSSLNDLTITKGRLGCSQALR